MILLLDCHRECPHYMTKIAYQQLFHGLILISRARTNQKHTILTYKRTHKHNKRTSYTYLSQKSKNPTMVKVQWRSLISHGNSNFTSAAKTLLLFPLPSLDPNSVSIHMYGE